MNFKEKAVSALLWSIWQQLSSKLVSFAISIFLARLLEPSQFGLIAMLSLFIAVSNTLLDSGLTSSLIRTTNPNQRDYSTIFYFNIAGSAILYIMLFFSAPLVALFYHQPQLIAIIRVYGTILIINAFFGVQSTLLIKDLKFRIQTNIQVPSTIGGGILGIVLAKMGYGVWSLVWMSLLTSFLSTAMHWLYSSWRPALLFDIKRFKNHFYFGYKMTISNLLDTIYQNFYLIVIGKYFSTSQLGFYSRAESLSQFPISNISAAINKVAYPMFAEISEDTKQLKNVYKRLIQQVLFWNAPVLVLLSVIAEPLFKFLLTDKWLPAVPYFKILCISGIMYPLHAYNLNILKVLGKSTLFLKIEIIKKILCITIVLIIIQFGMYGLLYFQLFFNFIAYYINSIYSGKLISYPVQEQIKDILPTLTLAGTLGICCYLLEQYLDHVLVSEILKMSLTSISFILLYYAFSSFFKISAIKDFNQLILKK
ncbi:MAG: capsule biosynthesis protein CapK [Mucilaginibacter sp.]|nr:capsule biosynthesis protein CapK [Mucilaginibacter sp.]